MLHKSIVYLLFFSSKLVLATSFPYPAIPGDSLIGNQSPHGQYAYARHEDTLLDIARNYDIGQNEIIMANPEVDRWLPGENKKIRIPNSRLLPDTPHDGAVLNLPEFRFYYYPKRVDDQPHEIITYPISIGRVDWDTPLGKTEIIAKNLNPVWRPPKSIKEEHAANGEILPDVFPAGPDNPLGLFALRLGVPGYLIHSTNKPYGVGMRVSHGCIRMYPEDIKKLFPRIEIGTPVYIVNQSIKVGWSDNSLYIEVYPELKGDESSYENRLNLALRLIQKANNARLPVIQGKALKQAIKASNGIPVAIYRRELIPP